MHKITFKIFVFLLLFINLQTIANTKNSISPAQFRWMSETSIHVMETYQNYNHIVTANNMPIYLNFDLVIARGKDYYLRTTHGNIDVHPGEFKFFCYTNLLIKEKWPFRFLLMINSLSMSSDLDLNPEKEDYYSEISWNSGTTLIAYRPIQRKNEQLTIGVQSNFKPYIIADSLNNDIFSVYYDEQDSIYKGTKSYPQLFLHYIKSGYDFGTMYNRKKNVIQLLELAKHKMLKKDWGQFITRFRYLNFLRNYQLGFRLNEFSQIRNVLLDLSLMWNIVRDNQWNDFSSLSLNTSINLNRKNNIEELMKQKQRYTTLDLGISYSKEVFNHLLFGASCNAVFHQMSFSDRPVFCDLGFGLSYNYHDNMIRLPLKDVMIMKFFIAFYSM